jgi:predicted double-glycine peptidase
MGSPARIAAVVLLALLLPGVGTAASGIYLRVPCVRQPKDGCGAACLVMILRYWQAHDSDFNFAGTPNVGLIQRQLYSKAAHGIYAWDLAHYLRQSGMQTFVFAGRWQDLEHHLTMGRPLIVCLKEQGWRGPRHYVVVTGEDPSRRQLLINDPACGKLSQVKWPEFFRDWKATGFWTLLAVPGKGL